VPPADFIKNAERFDIETVVGANADATATTHIYDVYYTRTSPDIPQVSVCYAKSMPVGL